MGGMAAILSGMGEFAEQENKQKYEFEQKQRTEILSELKAMAEELSLTEYGQKFRDLLLEGQMSDKPVGQNKKWVEKVNQTFYEASRFKRRGEGQQKAALQERNMAGFGLRPIPVPPPPGPIGALPGVNLPGITNPQPAEAPPIPPMPGQGMTTQPVGQLQSSGNAHVQQALMETELAVNKAVQIAVAQGQIEAGQAIRQRDDMMEFFTTDPRAKEWFMQLSPEQKVEAFLGARNLQRTATTQPSLAHLGAAKDFIVKASGETKTGIPDKVRGGYWVGEDFFPFAETASVENISGSDAARFMADGLKLAAETKGRPLTLQEKQAARKELRKDWAIAGRDPLAAENRRMNLVLMGRILSPIPIDKLPETEQQRIDGIADRWVSGQITFTEAARSLGSPRANLMPTLMDAVQRKGGIILPQSAHKLLSGVNQARTLLREIELIGEKIVAGEDTAYNTNLLRRKHGTFSVVMARARGEVGTMTEGDVSRAGNLMPGWVQANFMPGWFEKEIAWGHDMLDRQQASIVDYYRPKGSVPSNSPPGSSTGVDEDTQALNRFRKKYGLSPKR